MTILEAFQWAKEEGHYWADKALANLEKEYENYQVDNYSQAVGLGFNWNSSNESSENRSWGWDYWKTIHDYFDQANL